MTRCPRVLLDSDGVLSDFIGGALAVINELYGTAFTREQITEFDFTKSLGMSPAAAAACKRAIGTASGFARHLDVYPGAVDGVRQLQEISEVYIVTSPWNSNSTWCHDREWWLDRHFGIPHAHELHKRPTPPLRQPRPKFGRKAKNSGNSGILGRCHG